MSVSAAQSDAIPSNYYNFFICGPIFSVETTSRVNRVLDQLSGNRVVNWVVNNRIILDYIFMLATNRVVA